MSWLIFGILTGTAYLVQVDEAAGAGSWVMGITAIVCLLLCLMSFWRGERAFPWYEWAFLLAAAMIFMFYLLSRQPTIAAVLAAHRQRARLRPDGDQSLAAPALRQHHHVRAQQHKFVPSFFAMDSLDRRHLRHARGAGRAQRRGRAGDLFATCSSPSTVILRCERSEPRRMHGPGRRPSRAASRPPQGDGQRTSSLVLATAAASEFCQSQVHEKPFARKATRVSSGAPGGAGSWATPRGRMLPPAHASGVARATERSACANRLLRARCASRRSTTIAVLRRGCRPPPREFRSRSAGGRHRQAGVLTAERDDSPLSRNFSPLSSINSHLYRLQHKPQGVGWAHR